MRIYLVLGLMLCAVTALDAALDKLFCFYQTGAAYRIGNGRVEVGDLNPQLCTHLVYQYVEMTTYGAIQMIGLNTTELRDFVGLKARSPTVKIYASMGGPEQSSSLLSTLLSNPSLRRATVKAIVDFAKLYNLDGVDFHWQYPVLKGGEVVDRANYITLLSQLRTELKGTGMELSVSVAPTSDYFRSSYDVLEMNKHVDFVNVMAFDLHAYWDAQTGLNAPVFGAPWERSRAERELHVDAILKAWKTAGMESSKIILGVTAYGHSFKLANKNENSTKSRSIGPGPEGSYTAKSGVLSYLETCELMKSGGWTTIWDDVQQSHYGFKEDLWVSFESMKALHIKMNMADAYAIKGLGMWAMEGDDVRNICGGGNFSLLSFIYNQLRIDPGTTVTPSITTTLATTTTQVSEDGGLPPICPPSGFVRDPKECNGFYRCSPGSKFPSFPTKNTCASGLNFDTRYNVCNHAKYVTC
ncbi:acidic mammalian chitinase-like isoform X2 [Toxorhynchites rutilus septentrionalis]|uniref:acidic mammalian chitinase-like isoform X2 n=1 Tax=Toxorhynchites rutilus septentrionalis TaxID=329112 RepID=UPI002479EF00|nr:acidic mammalian chitinase-like isoform X2 [Toxorhynchites rutilus septentrionalis]